MSQIEIQNLWSFCDSFNLTLTDAEREARERVILPHMERQTESKIEIESEDEDDPDDDLDIWM